MAVDKKLTLFNNVSVFGGLELSGVTRESFTYHFSKPDDYRRFTTNPILLGGNIEIQYTFFNRIGLFLKGSMYQAEDILRNDGKKYRIDVTVGLVFTLFKKQIR